MSQFSNNRLSIKATFTVNVLIAVAGLLIITLLQNPLGLMCFYLLQPVFVNEPADSEEYDPEKDETLYGDSKAGFNPVK